MLAPPGADPPSAEYEREAAPFSRLSACWVSFLTWGLDRKRLTMRVVLLVVLALLAAPPTGTALAGSYCETPLEDWQPREALQTKLESQGWRGVGIRIEDGCYLVHAYNDQGERLHGVFDPATLEALPSRDRGHGHRGHGDGFDRGDG